MRRIRIRLMTIRAVAFVIVLLAIPRDGTAQRGGDVPALRVGAAKVDVTPSPGELPKNSRGILDRLYARAIVLESGSSVAALVTVDAGGIPDAIWQTVAGQIETDS
jgi:neutral ceramidase